VNTTEQKSARSNNSEKLPQTKPKNQFNRKRKKWTKHIISAKNICIDFKTNSMQYHCPYNGCDYVTQNKKTLYTHTRNKHSDQPFECEVCGKIMASINSLRIHSKTVHTDSRPFKCDKCDARFKLLCYVKRHEEEVHGDLKYVCDWPECHYRTTTKLNLERHTIGHTNERSFRCDWPACDLAFGRKSTLMSHIKAVHEDERFYCELCDLVFKKKHSLQVHIKHQHTNERPFLCDKCHKGFAARHILNKHLKIHLEKPYKD
jgi:KRAB domain-containing zinc finger protein